MRTKSLGVQAVVDRVKMPCASKLAKNVVCVFFREAKEVIKQGKEIKLPGKKNGTLSLVINDRKMDDLRTMKYIGTHNDVRKVLRGTIKPRLYDFDLRNAAPHCLVKDFKIKYSYPYSLMKELASFTDEQRSLLMKV